ncbi:unnamed protein product [Prorocentrum cordatum]|uniref:Peptidylprolyl isomerase n=1 Tax=Prorocentrum cordatum TaxID=2364126 RepID=A0ABN9P8V5_9DINO|nr:unnamed protein product [Polarella glacialis]
MLPMGLLHASVAILYFIVRAEALGGDPAAMHMVIEDGGGPFKELSEGELVEAVNTTLRVESSAPSGRAGAWSSAVCKHFCNGNMYDSPMFQAPGDADRPAGVIGMQWARQPNENAAAGYGCVV